MSSTLTSTERIARGLKYSTVGPIDLTRGTVGVALRSVGSTAAWVANRYRAAAQRAVTAEVTAAQAVVATIPQALQQVRKVKRRPRPLLLVGAGVAVLAVGAVTFSIVRRSTQPDPSPLPPSIEVSPKP